MNIRAVILAMGIAMSSATVAMASEIGYVTTVQVNYRTEIHQSIVPGACYTERVPTYGGNSSDIIAGAIIGGLIGNQFGHGSGRDAATAFGAIAGAGIASAHRRGYQYVQRCDDRISEQHFLVPDGYRVFYHVNGRTHTFYTYERLRVGDRVIHRRY